MDIFNKENIDGKIKGYNNEDFILFEKVKILDNKALATDKRIKSVSDDIKIIESRHSDDCDEWFCELGDNILVNHSMSFVITNESYNTLVNSKRNEKDARDKRKLEIFIDDSDIYYIDDRIKVYTSDYNKSDTYKLNKNNNLRNFIMEEINKSIEQKELPNINDSDKERLYEVIRDDGFLWQHFYDDLNDIYTEVKEGTHPSGFTIKPISYEE